MPPSDLRLDDGVRIPQPAERGADPDQACIQRRARRAALEVRLHGRLRRVVQLPVEVARDVAAGTPAAQRLCLGGQTPFVIGGERAHKHHPTPPQSLLGGRQPGPGRLGDLGAGPAQGVMEDDRHAVDDGQPRKRVLELVAHLRALEDLLRDHRPVVVVPVGLDSVDVELVAVRRWTGR